jgi:hypothetical protein
MATLTRLLRAYVDNWWVPGLVFAVALVCFAVIAITSVVHGGRFLVVVSAALIVVAVLFLGMLAATVWSLAKKRWAKGFAVLLSTIVAGVAGFIVLVVVALSGFFGPSEDHWADGLKIPKSIRIARPGKELTAKPGGPADTFQKSVLASLSAPGSDDPTITAEVNALSTLSHRSPDTLRRYLASSPAWRVFEEHGNVFATRRWMIGPLWLYSLHGYYTRNSIDTWSETGVPDFQTRFTVGLSGKTWVGNSRGATRLTAGETKRLDLSTGNQMRESLCVISAGPALVEVFEESSSGERRMTKAALAYVEKELTPLVARPDWNTIRKTLPKGSIRRRKPSLELINSFQPGIYDSQIWVNPGESGKIYLKAFEVTKGTRLSRRELNTYSNEWVGWSDEPGETFFSNTTFTIGEGDWGKPYAARFEVWFTPDSGQPDRKLIDKVFQIEGWQR